MSDINQRMQDYKARLDQIQKESAEKQQQSLRSLAQLFAEKEGPTPFEIQKNLVAFNTAAQALQDSDLRAQVNFTSDNRLKDLDEAFIRIFKLEQFYKSSALLYRTVYCESLEEFFTPIAEPIKISPKQKKELVRSLCEKAEQNADRGGIYGFNLPGNGCYINGWLFAHGKGITPAEALKDPALSVEIMKTVVHEKLGHGFLDIYSELGKVETSLGMYKLQIAQRFGMQVADDPISKIRQEQSNILSKSSVLQQEGWATWIESFFDARLFRSGIYPKYKLEDVLSTIEQIPEDTEEPQLLKKALKSIADLLFFTQNPDPAHILQAVNALYEIDTRTRDFFMHTMGQPLRYILGELIMTKIAINLGTLCVPYAALIAGNITLDPAAISLSDLRELFASDPALNPDARLLMLSFLELPEKDNVTAFARLAETSLSIQVPHQLKK